MSDIDPLDLLRAADPLSERSIPRPQMAPDALFEQITTSTPSIKDAQNAELAPEIESAAVDPHSPRSLRRWRPSIAMPAAAAVVGLVVGGAVLLQPGGRTPSASALVADAAATSAAFDSGHVVVTVDVIESPGDDMSGSFSLDYRFDRGDFAMRFDTSLFADATDEAGAMVVGDIDIRGIGDQLFSSYDEPALFFVSPRSAETESVEALFGFEPTSMEPATVVDLLEQTDDFQAVTSDDGITTYRGSVEVAMLEALGPDSLPAGLSLLADPITPNDDLPETLGVDVVVADGLLESLTIEIDGDSELGFAKGTITTTFSEYGEPQNIVAPPSDQISDDDAAGFPGGLPDGFEEAFAVLEEMESRRPNLCADVFTDASGDIQGEEILAQLEAFPVCLEEAGEQAAADAFRSMNQLAD